MTCTTLAAAPALPDPKARFPAFSKTAFQSTAAAEDAEEAAGAAAAASLTERDDKTTSPEDEHVVVVVEEEEDGAIEMAVSKDLSSNVFRPPCLLSKQLSIHITSAAATESGGNADRKVPVETAITDASSSRLRFSSSTILDGASGSQVALFG